MLEALAQLGLFSRFEIPVKNFGYAVIPVGANYVIRVFQAGSLTMFYQKYLTGPNIDKLECEDGHPLYPYVSKYCDMTT